MMKKNIIFIFVFSLLWGAYADWFWPFGNEAQNDKKELRLSELMEKASLAIDDAVDLADNGKISEAIEKYKEAIAELDRVERENPDRAKTPEFSTLRTKRAYSKNAITSLQMSEALLNARSVAVTDTTELEKKLADEKRKKREKATEPDKKKAEPPKENRVVGAQTNKVESIGLLIDCLDDGSKTEKPDVKAAPSKISAAAKAEKPKKSDPRRDEVLSALKEEQYDKATAIVKEMLKDDPNGVLPLNLLALICKAQGRLDDAEKVLFKCMTANKHSYYTYYNMARLYLMKNPPDKSGAKYYYETGCLYTDQRDLEIERRLK